MSEADVIELTLALSPTQLLGHAHFVISSLSVPIPRRVNSSIFKLFYGFPDRDDTAFINHGILLQKRPTLMKGRPLYSIER